MKTPMGRCSAARGSSIAMPLLRYRRSTRPVRCVFADGYEQSDDRTVRVRRVPGVRRVDAIFTRAEIEGTLASVRQLLAKNHVTLDAAHDLIARGMHFPARPALFEAEQADEASFIHVAGMPLLIFLVPFKAGELRLRDGLRAKAEVDREVVKRLALHRIKPRSARTPAAATRDLRPSAADRSSPARERGSS